MRTFVSFQKLVVTETRSQEDGDIKEAKMFSLPAYAIVITLDSTLHSLILYQHWEEKFCDDIQVVLSLKEANDWRLFQVFFKSFSQFLQRVVFFLGS